MATATTPKLTEHSKPLNNTEDDILLDYDFRLSSYTLGFSGSGYSLNDKLKLYIMIHHLVTRSCQRARLENDKVLRT